MAPKVKFQVIEISTLIDPMRAESKLGPRMRFRSSGSINCYKRPPTWCLAAVEYFTIMS